MVMERFVKAAGRKDGVRYQQADRIPMTDKVRTYCANASLYSRESDLGKIVSSQYQTVDVKKNTK